MSDESLKEEILVNVTPAETRAALLENGVLQEMFIERTARRGLISNIYNGRVTRVLPGMQAAFVDIGLERTAFLHASDIERNAAGGGTADEELPDIRELVREGDRLLVQVVKDPLGNKGARLTTFITLPSRHLVLLPRSSSVGISARIDQDDGGISLFERAHRLFRHALVDTDLATGDATGIDDQVGDRTELAETVLAVAGKTRVVGDQRVPRAGQAVEQRGFADVGPADQCDDGEHRVSPTRARLRRPRRHLPRCRARGRDPVSARR